MSEPTILVIGLGILVLFVLIFVVSAYNRVILLSNLVRESWANVDVALKRRHELIPNLVETVKGYAAHESNLFERVAAARAEAMAAMNDLARLRERENELAAGITKLLAYAEDYPELRASEHFLELQQELRNTEDRIAAARRFYNANVREYNTVLEQFPTSLFAGGRRPAEFFEIEDVAMREAPVVQA